MYLALLRCQKLQTRLNAEAKPFRNCNPFLLVGSYYFCLFAGGIEGSLWAHDRFIDDVMIRKFIEGTFYEMLLSDVIIKRTLNQITISIYVYAKGTTVHKVYFLLGFSEKLLSHLFGCVVKMEIMSIQT